MLTEFHSRIIKKRELIEKVKLKCKEVSLRDTMIICERCKQDLSLLKTVEYINRELHFAKCVFGYYNRIEVADALTETYSKDKEFI